MTKQGRGTKSPITLRRLIAVAAVLLVAALFMVPVAAADEVPTTNDNWINYNVTEWYTQNPSNTQFTISTPEQLAGLAAIVNGVAKNSDGTAITIDDFAGKTITLGADINLSGKEWTPIGTSSAPFNGNFDGNGKTISNLKIASASSHVGFFGKAHATSGSIKNLKLNNVDVAGAGYVGAIAGNGYLSTIDNCHVTGSIAITSTSRYTGGIRGYGYGKITSCTVIGTGDSNTISIPSGGGYVGGIAGWLGEGKTEISDCMVKDITISGAWGIGGITGLVHYGNMIADNTIEDVTLIASSSDYAAYDGLVAGDNRGKDSNINYIINNVVTDVTATAAGVEFTNLVGTAPYNEHTVAGTGVVLDDSKSVVTAKNLELNPPDDVVAANSYEKDNGDGTWSVKIYRVTIGETKYQTLQDAIDAATDGATITILEDLTEDDTQSITVDGKTVTFVAKEGVTITGEYITLQVANGGSVIKPVTMTALAPPDGYGWKEITDNSDNTQLTKTWDVTFGETGKDDVVVTVFTGESVAEGEIPSITDKTGYTSQWVYYDGTEDKEFSTDVVINADTSVTVQWTVMSYEITYYDNDGVSSLGLEPKTHTYDKTTTLPTPEKTGYTFDGWYTDSNYGGTALSELAANTYTGAITLYAKWTPTYTVTWKNYDGKELETDKEVPQGTTPTYNGDVPTKTETDTHTYTFKGWDKAIEPVKNTDVIYTAVFNEVEKQKKDEPAVLQPVILVQATTDKTTGETTIVATVASAVTVESKTEAKITDEAGTVTLKVKFDDSTNLRNGDTTLTGNVEEIEAQYKQDKAEAASGAGEIKHQLTINLKNLTTELPKIIPEFKQEVKEHAVKHDRNFIPLAMLTAEQTGSTTLEQINKDLIGNKVTLVFTVEKSVIDRYGKDNIFVMHLKNGELKQTLTPTVTDNGSYYTITVHGNGFSNYVLGVKEESSSGSSYTQGSSVWLQEPLTPTPTETPSEQPTDVAPTDVPTTQPTATQTETPGFGVLAVLGALGAVAVLRRK